MIGTLHGFKLVESISVPEFEDFPVKKHQSRERQKKSYHARIQKKWNKRYGVSRERFVLIKDDCIVAHPNTIRAIPALVDNQR